MTPALRRVSPPDEAVARIVSFAAPLHCHEHRDKDCCKEGRKVAAVLARVNRQWARAAVPRIWCCVDSGFANEVLSRLLILADAGKRATIRSHVRNLRVDPDDIEFPCGFSDLVSVLPNLSSVSFAESDVDWLSEDEEECSELDEVEKLHRWGHGTLRSRPVLRSLALMCRPDNGIRTLRLACWDFDEADLRDCLRNLRRLRNLEIQAFEALSDRVIAQIVSAVPADLKELAIGCRETGPHMPLLDSHMQMIMTRTNLSLLSIDGSHSLTDAALGAALAKFDNLVTLRLRHCPKITDFAIVRAASAQLTTLVLKNMPGITAGALVQVLGRLQELTIADCAGITDGLLTRYQWHALPKLESIGFRDLGNLTASSLGMHFSKPRAHLRRLDLSCTKADSQTVEALSVSCPGLVSLRLAGCLASREAVYIASAKLDKLELLDVRGMPWAEGEALQTLREGMCRAGCKIVADEDEDDVDEDEKKWIV
ncbi:hypothetical protein DFJ74DRAFT_770417 [Hyaloraphidium curvatum]|nr:hypothetical protein DFJ74DRAFT_770417 [Hyaloraphidium curvatum]